MTKIQEIGDTAPGQVVTDIDDDNDSWAGARSDGASPATFSDIRIPASTRHKGLYYDFGMDFEGTPEAGQVLGRVPVGRDLRVPVGFPGSYGFVQANPDATYQVDMYDDGVLAAVIEISTGGAFTFSNDGSSPITDIDIDAGSLVTFEYAGTGGSPAADQGIDTITILIGALIRGVT